MRIPATLITVFLTSSIVQADDESLKGLVDVTGCISIDSPLERLDCYDAAARDAGLTPTVTSEASAGTGGWRVNEKVNPLDDSRTVVLSLRSEEGRGGFNNTPITFIARCQSNETEVYTVWHTFVGDDSGSVYEEWKRVTVRIGDGRARQERWGVSTDKEAVFAPDWAGDFLKELVGEDKLIMQLTPYGDSPITAVFNIKGLETALDPLMDACNWSL